MEHKTSNHRQWLEMGKVCSPAAGVVYIHPNQAAARRYWRMLSITYKVTLG